jgi:pimeloyl-ACP methyl ester carboxylesterase
MRLWLCALALLLTLAQNSAAQTQPVTYGANAAVGKYAAINGVRIYYEIYGEGEPLMLLHGNGAAIGSFSQIIPELSKHFQVIAVDSRAQGKSTDSEAELTFTLMASDVSALIDQLHLGAVNVVGWSDGGNVGLELAIAHPRQVKRLVTFGANYSHVDFIAPSDKVVMQPDDPRLLSTKAAIAVALKSRPKLSPAAQKKLNDLDEKYPNIALAQLQQIQIPVLVVAGDHDAIKIDQTVSLFQNLPHAQLLIVPGASHFVIMEQSELVTREILAFLTTPYRDIATYYWMELLP